MTRDSVCMADDVDAPHDRRVAVARDGTLADALLAVAAAYLPRVSGVTAWRVEADGLILGWILRDETCATGEAVTALRGVAADATLATSAIHFNYIAAGRIAGSGLPPA